MIAQVEKTLFVTPDVSCEICDGTGAAWIDRDVNASDECACITLQIADHESAFSHYEIVDEKHALYPALKQLEKFEEDAQRERNRIAALAYKTTA